MCYNYFGDLAVARSMYRKQSSNQSLNNSNEVILRNRGQQRRMDRPNSSTKHVLLDKEYSNLKHLLPSLNNKSKISKVNLINEAVRYINELQEQVIQKLNMDPQIIQQKILDEFDQVSSQNNVHPVNSIQNNAQSINSSESVSNRLQRRSKTNKSRRTPLEEINVQKSIKRQRI